MQRKRLVLGLLITILLLFGWHYCFRLPGWPVHPLESVSNATALVVSYPDARTFLQGSSLALDTLLGLTLEQDQYWSDLTLLQQTLKPAIRSAVPLLVSLQNPGSGRLSLLAVADMRGQSFDLQRFLQQMAARRMQQFYYEGRPLYRIILPSRQELTVAQFRNLLLIAPYPLLVEEALNRLQKPFSVLTKQSAFQPLARPTQKKAPFSIYIKVENIPLLLSDWLHPTAKTDLTDWHKNLQWLRLEPQAEPDAVKLSGALTLADEQNAWTALRRQQARPIGAMMRVIPDNVALVQWQSLSNAERFFRQASRSSSEALMRYVAPWAGEELGLVRTQEDRFVVIRMKKNANAEGKLNEWAKASGELEPQRYGAFTIRQVLDETLLEPLFSKGNFSNPCFTTIEDFVVLASSRAGLEVWIDQYMVSKTMGRSTDFLRLYQKWKTRPVNSFVFLNFLNFAPKVRAALPIPGLLQSENLEQLGQIGLILEEKAGKWLLEGYWQNAASTLENRTNIVWKRILEQEAATPPMLVGNGSAEEPYALAIQDTTHQLYLLDVNGRVQWKKKLEGRLLSAVQGLNYFKNGASLLLFNTPNNIHLLDRQGAAQGTFPLHLQTPATNGVTVVDFDGNEQYSFFVACANGSIYGFDQLGRPLQGWNPLRGVGEVRHPLVHFQHDGKDFLLVLNESGKLFTFKRDGSHRFAPINLGQPCPTPPQVQLSGSTSRIVATDRSGTAHIINLTGGTFQLRLQPTAKTPVHFAFADIAGDARKDYLAVSDTTLAVHHYEGATFKLLYQYYFPVSQREVLAVRVPGREKALVGTVSAAKQQIFLLQQDGQLYPDFPLAGTTRFFIADLFKNGQQILIVANGDSVYAYRVRL